MDEIPFEEGRVINELVQFWQTCYEPRDLVTHIDRLFSTWGSGIGANFFRQVYEDLRTNKRSKYAGFSATEFTRFLMSEYNSQRPHKRAEHQAREKTEERKEYERRARADFDALGKEMAKATTRAELVELGRKRANLALHTGISYVYENHCWNCKKHISSAIHAQCPGCRFYICGSCGSCLCGSL